MRKSALTTLLILVAMLNSSLSLGVVLQTYAHVNLVPSVRVEQVAAHPIANSDAEPRPNMELASESNTTTDQVRFSCNGPADLSVTVHLNHTDQNLVHGADGTLHLTYSLPAVTDTSPTPEKPLHLILEYE